LTELLRLTVTEENPSYGLCSYSVTETSVFLATYQITRVTNE